jgi:hypothetical protein
MLMQAVHVRVSSESPDESPSLDFMRTGVSVSPAVKKVNVLKPQVALETPWRLLNDAAECTLSEMVRSGSFRYQE